MDAKLINFYFEQNGFKKKFNKVYFNYIRGEYDVKILAIESKIIISHLNNIIFETGLPKNEGSIVKWINILINKYEKESNQTNS